MNFLRCALFFVFSLASTNTWAQSSRVVGYFGIWSTKYGYDISAIPGSYLTHLNFAFLDISDAGECTSEDGSTEKSDSQAVQRTTTHGQLIQTTYLKNKFPSLKILASIGGWEMSKKFSDIAITKQTREKFVRSCLRFISKYDLDGVDIDWEFPVAGGKPTNHRRTEDAENFVLLLREFRSQLEVLKKDRYLLTIAAPAHYVFLNNFKVEKFTTYLDWINVMGYDFHDGNSKLTNHRSALFASPENTDPIKRTRLYANTDSAIKWYSTHGVPNQKLVLGLPFYGRGWKNVPNINNGLYQSHQGEVGGYGYSEILGKLNSGYIRYWDNYSKAPWLYSSQDKTMISYEDPESIQEKVKYIKRHRLGGSMFWELLHDYPKHELTQTLFKLSRQSQ